jgi:replicative DNA helicase
VTRQLPHSESAERSVLGAVLIRPDCFDGIDLRAEQFFDPRARAVWQACRELRGMGRAIDVGTLEDALTRAGALRAIGGLAFLSELALVVPTAANVEHYAAIVREHATTREVMLAASEVLEAGYSGAAHGDDLLAQLGTAARGIRPSQRHAVYTARELAERRTRELLAASEQAARGETPGRIPTGLDALDEIIGGLPRGNHVGLVANTGHGKTATLMHMAFHAPVPALYFTFEELERDLVDRFMAARTGVPGIAISTLRLNVGDFSALIGSVDTVPLDVHFVAARGMTDEDVTRIARQKGVELGVGLVVVDYLNRVRLSASPKLRTDERMRHAIGMFDDACGTLDCAWVTAAQVNRGPEKENRPPRITDARECAALEEYSKLGLVVHRPNKGRPRDEGGDNELDVIVDKQNLGPGRSICRFGWHGPTMTISPISE